MSKTNNVATKTNTTVEAEIKTNTKEVINMKHYTYIDADDSTIAWLYTIDESGKTIETIEGHLTGDTKAYEFATNKANRRWLFCKKWYSDNPTKTTPKEVTAKGTKTTTTGSTTTTALPKEPVYNPDRTLKMRVEDCIKILENEGLFTSAMDMKGAAEKAAKIEFAHKHQEWLNGAIARDNAFGTESGTESTTDFDTEEDMEEIHIFDEDEDV